LKIGKREIEYNKPVYIVAEAGINHNGDLKLAKKMIESASKCGADAIKFQTIFPEELFSQKLNPELYSLIQKLSFNKKQHIELKKFAIKNKIEFFSTPVGIKSTKLLHDIKVNVIKIASGELTNFQLIKYIAKSKTPMIISTGMSKIDEIKSVVEIVKNENCQFMLLHTTSSYPTSPNEANLSSISFLREKFGVPVGYSDHTLGIDACLAAIPLGACLIEKHFTLNKNFEGPDHKLSADEGELKELVTKSKLIKKFLGKPRSDVTKSEKKFRKLMRKSIVTKTNITKGTKIKKSMLTFLRPGTGIPPFMIDKIVGKKIKQDIKKGMLLQQNMF